MTSSTCRVSDTLTFLQMSDRGRLSYDASSSTSSIYLSPSKYLSWASRPPSQYLLSDFQRLAFLSSRNVGSRASRSISERLCLPLSIRCSKTRTRMRLFVTMKRSLASRRPAWISWTLHNVNSMLQWRCKSCYGHILPCQHLIRSRTLHYTRKRISEFSNQRTLFVKVKWPWSSWLFLILWTSCIERWRESVNPYWYVALREVFRNPDITKFHPYVRIGRNWLVCSIDGNKITLTWDLTKGSSPQTKWKESVSFIERNAVLYRIKRCLLSKETLSC